MIVHTKAQVLKKINDLCDEYKTYADCARAIPCTKSQLHVARIGDQPPCPAILKKIGIERLPLYVSKVDAKYREEA